MLLLSRQGTTTRLSVYHIPVQQWCANVSDSGKHSLHARKGCQDRNTSNQNVSVMMLLIMRVVMTIRTGRCAPHSAAWFARVPATHLAQRHPSPEVACELPHFLWKWHRLIEISQELTKGISSCHSYDLPIAFVVLYHSPIYWRFPRP